MSRSSSKTSKIQGTKGRKSITKIATAEQAAVAQPGELSQYIDHQQQIYWEFVGNDTTTGEQVIQRIMHYEYDHGEKQFEPLLDNEDFLSEASEQLLGQKKTPLPSGKVYPIHLKALLFLVEPFLQSYAQSQQQTGSAAHSIAHTEAESRTLGKVFHAALEIPLDEDI